MSDTVRRMALLLLASCMIAYAIFLYAGKTVHTTAHGLGVVHVRDAITPTAHHLSGMVTVSHTCDELALRVEALSPVAHRLVFTTHKEHGEVCAHQEVPRSFSTSVIAPAAGVRFIATLDGRPLQLVIHQEYDSATL
jgi:hypothetical protein